MLHPRPHMHRSRALANAFAGLALALAPLAGLGACAGSAPGLEQGEDAPVSLPHAEAVGLLRFLNDAEVATFATLDETCAIRSDSADLLLSHRDGPDGLPGTADDRPFTSVAEVQAVKQVGPWTLDRLVSCAAELGYLGTPEEQRVLGFLNQGAQASLRVLHQQCGLRAEAATQIATHRDGPDAAPGTADDDLFDDPAELRALAAVGPWAFTQLDACAARAAGDAEALAVETETEVHGLAELDPDLAAFLLGDLLDYARRHGDPSLPGEVRFGGEVTIHAVAAEPRSYDVLYLQGAGSAEAPAARILLTLGADRVVQSTRLER